MQKIVDSPFVSYVKTSDLTPAIKAALAASAFVKGTKAEGSYTRIDWLSYEARKSGVDHEGYLGKLNVPSLEGDVHPIRRLFSDNPDLHVAKPKRLFLDIETDSRVSFSHKEDMRVLCWACVDETGKEFTGMLEEFSDDSEHEILSSFWTLCEDYDQLIAWNGDRFDFELLKERAKRVGVHVRDFRRWLYLDHLVLFKRQNMNSSDSGEEKQSYKLDDIANAVLKKGKLEDFDSSKTYDYWARGGEDRAKLLKYNLRDTHLLREIEDKTGYIALFQALCEVCKCFPDTRSLNPTVQMDGFMLSLGVEVGYHFPTRYFEDFTPDKYPGAYVQEPSLQGIGKDVHVGDFKSLYPSIIITWNMSPETKGLKIYTSRGEKVNSGWCVAPTTGWCFRTDKTGILPTALKTLIKLRKVWADKRASLPPGTPEAKEAERRSTAYKVAANSFYGVVGSQYSRFYDRDIAESITQTGAYLIKQTMKAAELKGWRSIYGDTDSVFIMGVDEQTFRAFVDNCNKTLYPKIAANCIENTICLDCEKGFARLVFTSAKRYCNTGEAPIWMGDYTFKQIKDVQIGDTVIGWVRGRHGEAVTKRTLTKSVVVGTGNRESEVVKVTMKSGRVIRCTPDHLWLNYRSRNTSEFGPPKVGRKLAHVIDQTPELSEADKIEASWLGGIFDGEGSLCSSGLGQIVIAQSRKVNPEVCDRIEAALTRLGFSYHPGVEKACPDMLRYSLHQSKQIRLNFVNWCNPAKRAKIEKAILKSRFGEEDEIVSIEPDGYEEVYSLTTTTGNYIAWGYASKNCGFYSYYKNAKAKADSEPEIKGLEYKRGDTPKLARTLQKRIIDMICKEAFEDAEIFIALIKKSRDWVMNTPLDKRLVQLSKSISKPLDEYVNKEKNDGSKAEDLTHVKIAKLLKERGQDITQGSRVFYVVTDASCSPMKAIPADDYQGECDKYYLWEKLIYPPSMRLLCAAFPAYAPVFESLAKVRPSKRVKVADEQLGLGMFDTPPANEAEAPLTPSFDPSSPLPPAQPTKLSLIKSSPNEAGSSLAVAGNKLAQPLKVLVTQRTASTFKDARAIMQALGQLLSDSPGKRPVSLEIEAGQGTSVVLLLPHKVSVTPGLLAKIKTLFPG